MSLYCPKCEKRLEDHKDGACPKEISRRFFLGTIGTALAASAAAKILPNFEIIKPSLDALVVNAATKVHRSATITLEGHGNWLADRHQMIDTAEHIAAKHNKSVIIIHNGEVLHHVDLLERRLL